MIHLQWDDGYESGMMGTSRIVKNTLSFLSLPYGASSSAVNFRAMSICALQESIADSRMEGDDAFYLFHQDMGISTNGR